MDVLILILLILLNGVFALSEMAIVSSRKPRLRAMAERGSKGARIALRLMEDPSKLLSTVQIGITLIGVIAGAYGATAIADDVTPWLIKIAPQIAEYAAAISFGCVIALTTLLSLLFGELVPKRVALAAPERLAVMMAPFMALIENVASPLVWFLRAGTEAIIKLFGLNATKDEDVTEEELQSLIQEGAMVGVIEMEERDMIEGVMRFADRSVRTVMTPRTELVWIDPDQSQQDILNVVKENGHSRYPVARGEVDKLIGIVQAKDLLTSLAETGKMDVEGAMHPPTFVPETVPVFKLLESMRATPVRMVFVADEYGALLGVVTAADLLESIVGDAALSEDEGLSPPVLRHDGSWLIDGMTPIDELSEIVGIRLIDLDDSYSTVAGLVMHLMRAVPSEGDRTELEPLSFEVVDMDGRRIDKVLVKTLEPRSDETG